MITRRRLFAAAGALGLVPGLSPSLVRASTFSHVGPTLAIPTVSQSLKGVLDASDVPALGYAVVGPKGVSRLEVAGRRRADRETLATREDVWHLGSNTEAFTTAAYARLVEKGQAIWGANVGLLFPDLTVDPAWRDVSLEEFLAHRSGASDLGLLDEAFFKKVNKDQRPLPVQRSEMVQRLFSRPPEGARRDYEYANVNYVVAGAAIERLTEGPWEDAMTTLVFTPLNLASAGFGAPVGDEPWGHDASSGAPEPVDPAAGIADNPPVLAPGGQIHLSLVDYARFVGIFLSNGGGFLKPETLMHIARPEDAFAEGDALGWRVSPVKAWAEGPLLAHEGSNTLWRALVEVAPARPLALLVVTNAGGEAGARAVQMMSARLISEEVKEE